MSGTDKVWAVGGDDLNVPPTSKAVVVRSLDGFKTPATIETPTPVFGQLNDVWTDGRTVHAVGNRTVATFDGVKWSTQQRNYRYLAASFLGNSDGSLAGYDYTPSAAYLLHIDNQALTGNDLSADLRLSLNESNQDIRGLSFQTSDTGWIVSRRDIVRQTGTQTFKRAYGFAQGVLGSFTAVAFRDSDNGIVTREGATPSVKVFDPTWPSGRDPATPPASNALFGAHLTPKGFGVVVGQQGFLAETVDSGLNWRTRAVGITSNTLRAVTCHDENHCVAVGDRGEILMYENLAPTIAIATNQPGSSFSVDQGVNVCLTGTVSDPEGEPTQFTWAADVALKGVGGNPSLGPVCFEAPTQPCEDRSYGITLAATVGSRSATATATAQVKDIPLRVPSNVVLAQVDPGPPFVWDAGPGRIYDVKAAADSECPAQYSFSVFSASPEPIRLLGRAPDTTRVDLSGLANCIEIKGELEAKAVDRTGSTTGKVGFTVKPARFPPKIEIEFPAMLEPGKTIGVVVKASHCPATKLSYSWKCKGSGAVDPGNSDRATFTHPGGLECVPQPPDLECTVTVRPDDGSPSAERSFTVPVVPGKKPVSITLDGLPAQGIVSAIQAKAEVVATATRCPNDVFSYGWACDGRGVGANGARAIFTHPITECAEIFASCRVTATHAASGESARADLAITYAANPDFGRPAILSPDLDSEASWREPVLDCRVLEPVVVEPRVIAGCAPPVPRWRQLSDLPLELSTIEGDRLRISVPVDRLFEVVGHTARLELVETESVRASDPQVYEVRFKAKPMVRLEHRADRPEAAAGEVMTFSVVAVNTCEVRATGLDLVLSVEGMTLLADGAQLDGTRVPVPDRLPLVVGRGEVVGDAERVAFRGLSLPPQGAAPSELVTLARRSSLGGGKASSVAQVFLSADPSNAVSEAAAARSVGLGPGAGLAVVACDCQAADGSPSLTVAVLFACSLRTRFRAPRAATRR
jgi:hypothetical protein